MKNKQKSLFDPALLFLFQNSPCFEKVLQDLEAEELDVVALVHALHDGLGTELPAIVGLLQLLEVRQGLRGDRIGSDYILDEGGQVEKRHGGWRG